MTRLTEIIDATRRGSIESAPAPGGSVASRDARRPRLPESRFAAVEAVHAVAAAPDEAMTVRLADLEQEVGGVAAAAEQLGARIGRLERETAEPVTSADIDTLRTEIWSELAERLAGEQADTAEETEDLIAIVGKDLTQRLDRLARQQKKVAGLAAVVSKLE